MAPASLKSERAKKSSRFVYVRQLSSIACNKCAQIGNSFLDERPVGKGHNKKAALADGFRLHRLDSNQEHAG